MIAGTPDLSNAALALCGLSCSARMPSILLLSLALASGQEPPRSIRDLYQKIEYRIPMRDGVKLYTQVYVPKNRSAKSPILLERTPYGAGPVGPDRFPWGFKGSSKFVEKGYIFTYQDVRGKRESEGEFVNIRPMLKAGERGIDESTDASDTIDFLVKNVPNNNGNVGIWGISYPGFYAAAAGRNSHPALKAISPQAPVSDWFVGDDVRHNGAFFLQDNFDFSVFFDVPRGAPPIRVDRGSEGAYAFFLKTGALQNFDRKWFQGRVPYWNEIVENDTLNDYWRARSLPDKLKGVKASVLTVGGWYDHENLWGALNVYAHIERQNPGIANTLVMGPWSHGQWAGQGNALGDIAFGSDTSDWYRENVEFPFFERTLRGQAQAAPAEAIVFQTGANRWRNFSQWPPKDVKPLAFYVGPDKSLTRAPASAAGADRYVNDPANPTPYLANPRTGRRPQDLLVHDQRWAIERADVLTYRSPVLTEDLTLAGPIEADLWVTTSGTDADFVVKVIDEWPADSSAVSPRRTPMAGFAQMVRADVMRGKFRNSLSKPEPFVPGQPTRVRFKLNDAFHTFRKGHRVMLQVQSSWFPLVDRNPNRFMRIHEAKDSDYQKATIEILRGPKHPTSIRFSQWLGQ